ncbi:DsbA family protein [Acetobacteraceae bacterium KSS8]|uniref:DsbA family protein n=1 Tax=Endosaccharibacter trunci TaxID=2812733 RepID=A0ABT1W625_9PROT|nr:DsbA family protein [Acetobacteraceae bacterium KSS8]
MSLSRRALLIAAPGLALVSRAAFADTQADPLMGERAIGNPNAKLVVQEWYSMTCTHCARFSQVVFPEVKAKLIDTGRIRYVFQDYPLDQVALMACMVARALPTERYVPFVESLLASQDRWAFAQGVDPKAELQKMAALAGMSSETFQHTINDEALSKAIIAKQDAASKKYGIDSTPSFLFGSTLFSGEMDYATFAQKVAAAGG